MRHLEEGERLLQEATPGPWEHEQWKLEDGLHSVILPSAPEKSDDYVAASTPGFLKSDDASLIVYAVNNLSALLRVARAAQAAYDEIASEWGEEDELLMEVLDPVRAELRALEEVE